MRRYCQCRLFERFSLSILLVGLMLLSASPSVLAVSSRHHLTGQQDSLENGRVLMAQAIAPPTEIISRLFTEPDLQTDWFAPSFLSQISLAELRQIIRGIQGSMGEYQSIADVDNGFVLTFERGTVPAHLALNAQGQITGLLFEAPELTAVDIDTVIAEIAALPGKTSVVVQEADSVIAELNADDPLAVASAFKLQVLAALRSQIESGTHQWDDIIPIDTTLRSLPSGFTQTWPDGSPVTLSTLATLMISQSDNTATDHLINLVGRENIEAQTPGNQPFLTTREAFVLKDPSNQRLLSRWRSGRNRRSLLAPLASLPLPPVSLFNSGQPLAPEVEWFYSTKELCQLMDDVADLPLMQINPGLIEPREGEQIAYKGGSEPGVLNFTTHITRLDGTQVCVAATWNTAAGEEPVDEIRLTTLYRSLLASVRESGE